MTFRAILVLFAVLFLAASGSAQRDLKDIPNPDPEVERTSFQLADGLEANLFASEPMIRKPIQMAWDQRGRLWVASSETYPQIRPGDPSDDKIVVLEDTDGDGKADKSTVFADNLLIPTGVLPADGGCYVANSTQMLFLRDSDGDGKADQRKILLSGFGTEDTHHILHTFRQGPDGMVYFAQSVYIHTHAETPFGVRRMGGGGFWHFRPESGQLEVYTRGQVNPWGLVFDRWGQSFTTDGAYSEGVNYAFPGAAYFWAKEADDWTKDFPRILKGLSPGQPKHCGIEIISGRHFPESWSGSMVAPDFRGNRINRFLISDAGSGYAAKQVEDVIKTTHRAFRPVDVNLGPDGALYVADWYNPIIQHGEVDFRDERRDHTHGRIWRIAMKDRPLVPKPKIAGATDDELLEMLEASEDWTRAMVRRELRERARASESRRESISRTLTTWLARLSQDASDTERCVLEAMWAAQSAQLWQVNSSLAKELERSTEPKVRAAALRSYYHNHVTASGAFKLIALSIEEKLASQSADPSGVSGFDPFISDPHPRVRLEAIHCLRALQTPQATEIALRALDKEMDENLDFALWLTCRETQDVWLPAFQKGEINFGGNTAHAVFALKATGNPAALAPLVSALREDKISDKDRPQVLQLIASMGGPAELGLLLDVAATLLSQSKNDPATGVSQLLSVLDLLAQTVRSRNVKPERADRALRFLDSPDAAIRHAAARLCGALKLEPARQTLVAWLGDPKLDAAAHQAALDGLLSLGGQATLKILTSLIEKADAPPVQRGQAIQALAALDLKAAAKRAAEFLTSLGDTAAGPAAATPVFDAFVTKKEGPAALVAALSDKKLSEPIARIGLQKAGSAGGDTKALQAALATAANMKPMDQALTPEQMSALVEEVKKNGDAAHGQEIYRRKELLCQTCHAIAGGGSEVGPDMVSLGAAAQIDYLIESLLNPSAKIKEGYHTTVVSTKDGSVFAGTVVKKDDQAITLRDAASQTKVIPIGNVAKQEIQPISLMPPGLTANLRRDEFCHLVKFMSELGREGAFKVPTQSYVRRWRILHPTEEMGRAHNLGGDRIFASEDLDLDWQPDYSTVDGSLPAVSVPLLDFWNKFKRGVAQFEIEMLKPGTVTLGFLEPAGLKVVAGERVLDANERTTLELPAARQKVAVFFEASRHAPLRVELIAEPSATGQARLVTGR